MFIFCYVLYSTALMLNSISVITYPFNTYFRFKYYINLIIYINSNIIQLRT